MSIATTDLNLLKAADALLLELSVTRAAERSGVTQQAMSGQLKRLRELFDDELLVQRGRQLGPTPLGSALIQPIRDALIHVERVLVTRPAFEPRTTRRSFEISSLSYAGATLVPHLVAHLQHAAPHAVVRLKPLESRFFVDLAESRFDLCLLNSRWRENQGPLPPEARTQPLYTDTWVVIGDRSRFPGSSISLDTYAAAHHVVVDLGPGGLTSIQKAWIRHRLSPHAACVKQSFSDILFMLPGTGLLGTVQEHLARLWAPRLGLSIFPSPIEIDPVDVEMMWHERDDDDLAHRFLRSSLVTATSALMDAPGPKDRADPHEAGGRPPTPIRIPARSRS